MSMNVLVSILVAAFMAASIMTAEHYFPWSKIRGKKLHPVANYVLGVVGFLVPFTLLVGYWEWTATTVPLWTVALAVWATTIAAGGAVVGCYAIDRHFDGIAALRVRLQDAETRALDAEQREAALKASVMSSPLE